MIDPEDRILDLALEELHGSRESESERVRNALKRLERRVSPREGPPRARLNVARKAAAVAASVLSFSLASWFILSRSGPTPDAITPPSAGDRLPGWQGQSEEDEVRQWVEQLSDPDAAVRDRASAALKGKGPAILGRLREEVGRTQDAEANARLQELIAYWTTGIAARVDGEIVKWDEIDATFKGMKPRDITPELRKATLQAVVEERAFLHEARRRGIVATEKELGELIRRAAGAAGGEEAYRAALFARGRTLEREREDLCRQLILSTLHDRILEEARANPGADPFRLDLNETPREELRRWYDANPDKFAGVDRVDVCWVELPFGNDAQKAEKKTVADAILAESRTRKSLGLACSAAGVQDTIYFVVFERGRPSPGPLGEETKKLLFDGFALGEVRVVEDRSAIFVVQLYDKSRRASETFEEAEPALRGMFENQRREENRKRMREGILKRAQIWPPDLFKGP